MLFILLGTIIAGVGAAGLVILFYKFILNRPRPKGAVPICAGIAMIALQIVLDYGWYSRATADFGDDIVVLQTAEGKSLLQPLSYIIPRTDRFLAFDKSSLRTHNAVPGVKLGTLFQAEKDGPTTKIRQLIDCTGQRRADWPVDIPPTPDELEAKVNWFALGPEDALLLAACD